MARATLASSVTVLSIQPVATIVLAVRGGIQQAWTRQEEMGEATYQALLAETPPPKTNDRAADYRQIDNEVPVQRITCTHCRIRPGFGLCPRCQGVGVLLSDRPGTESVLDCPDCEDGFATCTVCGGSTQSRVVTVRYVTIKPLRINHVIPCHGQEALKEAYPDKVDLPSFLAYDLESSSAYRGTSADVGKDYFGFSFEDTIVRAKAFIDRLHSAPSFLVDSLQSFAMPYLLVHLVTRSQIRRRAVFCIDARQEFFLRGM